MKAVSTPSFPVQKSGPRNDDRGSKPVESNAESEHSDFSVIYSAAIVQDDVGLPQQQATRSGWSESATLPLPSQSLSIPPAIANTIAASGTEQVVASTASSFNSQISDSLPSQSPLFATLQQDVTGFEIGVPGQQAESNADAVQELLDVTEADLTTTDSSSTEPNRMKGFAVKEIEHVSTQQQTAAAAFQEPPQADRPQASLPTASEFIVETIPGDVQSSPPINTDPSRPTPATTQSMLLQVAEATQAHVPVARHNGDSSFTVRLDPPELGEVLIKLKRTEGGINMRIAAMEQTTQQLLDQHQGDLFELMADNPDEISMEFTSDTDLTDPHTEESNTPEISHSSANNTDFTEKLLVKNRSVAQADGVHSFLA